MTQTILKTLLIWTVCVISCASLKKGRDEYIMHCDDHLAPGEHIQLAGICDLRTKREKVRTIFRAESSPDKTTVICIDEMGVSLVVAHCSQSGISVERHWPPVSKASAEQTGLLARCYSIVSSQNTNSSIAGVITQKHCLYPSERADEKPVFYITEGTRKVFRSIMDSTQAILLSMKGDTLIQFSIQ